MKLQYNTVRQIAADDLNRVMRGEYGLDYDQACDAMSGPDGASERSVRSGDTRMGRVFTLAELRSPYGVNPTDILTGLCKKELLEPGEYQIIA